MERVIERNGKGANTKKYFIHFIINVSFYLSFYILGSIKLIVIYISLTYLVNKLSLSSRSLFLTHYFYLFSYYMDSLIYFFFDPYEPRRRYKKGEGESNL